MQLEGADPGVFDKTQRSRLLRRQNSTLSRLVRSLVRLSFGGAEDPGTFCFSGLEHL